MKSFKKITAITTLFFFFWFSFLIPKANAQLGYGGLVTVSIPCTCSVGLWIFFTPLYLGSPVPVTGALHYVPGVSDLYEYYLPGVPSTWEVGTYAPGPGACYQYVGVACVLLPALGIITQLGTSA